MKDLMIDLETMGTDVDAPVISIGAQFFDLEKKTLGPTFYMALDISDQLGNRPISASTLKWWMGQEDAAKKVFHEKAQPTNVVLTTFSQWFNANNSKAFVWGNGSSFDISIMEHLFRQRGILVPWGYNKIMDLRTFKRFKGSPEAIRKSGVAHNALDDARSQAVYVLENS